MKISITQELKAVRREHISRIDQKNVTSGNDLLVPIREKYLIYESCIPKIGLLSASELEAVVRAYSYLYSYPEHLSVLGTIKRTDTIAIQMIISDKYINVLNEWDKTIASEIDTTIEALTRK